MVQRPHRTDATTTPRIDERRVPVLRCLLDGSTPVDLDELANQLVDTSFDAPGRDANSLDRVRLRLHHVDLPHLADAGVIEYDPARRVVTPARDPSPESPPV